MCVHCSLVLSGAIGKTEDCCRADVKIKAASGECAA